MLDTYTLNEFYGISMSQAGFVCPEDETCKIAEARNQSPVLVKMAQMVYEQTQKDGVPYDNDYLRSEDAFKIAEAYLTHQNEATLDAADKMDRLMNKLAEVATEFAEDVGIEGMSVADLLKAAALQADTAAEFVAAIEAEKTASAQFYGSLTKAAESEDEESEDEESDDKDDKKEGGEDQKEAASGQVDSVGYGSFYHAGDPTMRDPSTVHVPMMTQWAHQALMHGSEMPSHVAAGITPDEQTHAVMGRLGAAHPSQYNTAAHNFLAHVQNHGVDPNDPAAVQAAFSTFKQPSGLGAWAGRNKGSLLAAGGLAAGAGALYMLHKKRQARLQQQAQQAEQQAAEPMQA